MERILYHTQQRFVFYQSHDCILSNFRASSTISQTHNTLHNRGEFQNEVHILCALVIVAVAFLHTC
jgi:hypothetical protein